MSNSPRIRKMPPRPKILIPVPGQYYGPQTATGMSYVSTPYGQTPLPMTPVAGKPQMFYSNRASEFVFTQFKGIKDLTKSGLSVGEKSAYWLYEKVSSWSKRWFTHIFLFVIILLYSIAGAMIFIAVEGTAEEIAKSNIRQRRNETVVKIRGLCDDSVLMSDSPRWRGAAAELILDYETDLYDYYKRKLSDTGEKVWTFWNTVFYCGTIYTTIDFIYLSCAAFFLNEKSKARGEIKAAEDAYRAMMYVYQFAACVTRLISSSVLAHCFAYRFR
ncbi:uncharacterized protein LOC113004069 [Solenopsis invicta]|uniref:uncharacterized protein LOC113004069 n=1 Tax=Solenopsis invicta TaxID=13686 RepID=UPI00193E46FF|nr:uncharacterized protein LOC113004069 [Solenopsis invicta]